MFRFKARSAGLEFPIEFDEFDKRILRHVIGKRLTMVSRERLFATLMACRHACESGISGAFVECGVWRGGNAIIAADVFSRHGKSERVLLFDTFSGMAAPGEHDFDHARREPARDRFEKDQRATHNAWAFASLDEVKRNFAEANVRMERVEFIKGDVLETLNVEARLPSHISVLRLDTDWYESTKKELNVLWPRLSSGGILMIDDYGHWAGAKKAADEFFEGRRPFFQYIDYTGRLAVKM